jgi:hypothetical protein
MGCGKQFELKLSKQKKAFAVIFKV